MLVPTLKKMLSVSEYIFQVMLQALKKSHNFSLYFDKQSNYLGPIVIHISNFRTTHFITPFFTNYLL